MRWAPAAMVASGRVPRRMAVKLWTPKFAAALVLLVLFLLLALPLGLATDPETEQAVPVWPWLGASGPSSFVFLLLVLFVLSHLGGWVLARFRGTSGATPVAEPKQKNK